MSRNVLRSNAPAKLRTNSIKACGGAARNPQIVRQLQRPLGGAALRLRLEQSFLPDDVAGECEPMPGAVNAELR